MAENEIQNAENEEQQAQQPVFQMQRCYLKDASLEMPNAPQILMQPQQEQPQVDIQFEVSQTVVQDNLFDVTVRGTITVKAGEHTIILVEGKQSGLFVIQNIPQEAVQHVTNVLCPTMVYPYLRGNLFRPFICPKSTSKCSISSVSRSRPPRPTPPRRADLRLRRQTKPAALPPCGFCFVCPRTKRDASVLMNGVKWKKFAP